MNIYLENNEYVGKGEWGRIWLDPSPEVLQELEDLVDELDLKRSSILVFPMPHILGGPAIRFKLWSKGALGASVRFFHDCAKAQDLYDKGQDSGGDLLLREAKWKERIGLG